MDVLDRGRSGDGMIHVKVEFEPCIHLRVHFAGCIHLKSAFDGEIHVTDQFDMTGKEMAYMLNLVGDAREKRQVQISKLYFSLKFTTRQIADHLNISKSLVHYNIMAIRRNVLKELKKDLRANKKVLGHMVDLTEQVNERIKTHWQNYATMEQDLSAIRNAIRQRAGDANTSVEALITMHKLVLMTHDKRIMILHELREESKTLLQIWDRFGLCGEDATKLVMSGGVDVDVKVKEMKEYITKVLYIVKDEIKDERHQKRVFARMMNQMKEDYLNPKAEDEEYES